LIAFNCWVQELYEPLKFCPFPLRNVYARTLPYHAMPALLVKLSYHDQYYAQPVEQV